MRKALISSPAAVQGRFPREPACTQSFLVHTVFGASIVNAGSIVYARIGGEYASKPIDEVKKGEEILFSKEGIPCITIEKVSEALAKSARYAAAQPVLFKRLRDGSYTTSFRFALLEGMARAESVWPWVVAGDAGFRMRMADRGPVNLGEAQAAAAAEHIRAKLEQANVPAVSASHIRYGWLEGKVIAPRGREAILPPLIPLAQGLSKLLEPEFNEAYRLYVVIRQTVMRAVSIILKGNGSGGKGIGPEDENPEEPAQRISARPEIRLVAEHFATDISMNYAAARVLDVEELGRSGEIRHARESGELFRGIVTGKVSDPQIRIKPPRRIPVEQTVAGPIQCRIIYEFLMRKGLPAGHLPDVFSGVQSLLGFEGKMQRAYVKSMKRMKEAGVKRVDEFMSPNPPVMNFSDSAKALVRELQNGELDNVYGCQTGTVLRFFEHCTRLDAMFPDDFFYRVFLQTLITAKKSEANETGQAVSTKIEERELEKASKKLKQMEIMRPGPDTAVFLCTGSPMSPHMDDIYSGRMAPLEILRKKGRDVEGMKARGDLMDDEAALQVLREMGFGELERLHPKANELVKPYFTGMS